MQIIVRRKIDWPPLGHCEHYFDLARCESRISRRLSHRLTVVPLSPAVSACRILCNFYHHGLLPGNVGPDMLQETVKVLRLFQPTVSNSVSADTVTSLIGALEGLLRERRSSV